MKRLLPFLLVIVAFIWFSSCEKDDICVEGDTPLLVLGFYDINDTLVEKVVPSLRIKEVQQDTILNTFTDRSSALDSIGMPLRLTVESTSFAFINNSATDSDTQLETGNIDTLTFNYTVNEKYISRACGYVANFNELDTVRQVFTSDWIKRITILKSDIENSNAIHVKIFH
ncbi:MAG: hypothetical protein HKP38_02180 [Croceitalea sp.]|nr:hypothetical protein [Croceitalea sp.]NNC33455.1 hypothetical protein [Croceitalea sp.]NNL08007.1 hypothetical protein [Croceitalea sp.]NNM19400.1 hypothetical protein [Croceitalea sp.]